MDRDPEERDLSIAELRELIRDEVAWLNGTQEGRAELARAEAAERGDDTGRQDEDEYEERLARLERETEETYASRHASSEHDWRAHLWGSCGCKSRR